MVRRVLVQVSSWLPWAVFCLAMCGVGATAQSAQQAGGVDTITTPTFTVAASVSLPATPTSVAAGDLRGSGLTDLVVTESGSGRITVLLNNGSGGFFTASSYSAATTANFVALADLNGDGKLDAVVADTASGTVVVLPGKGDGSFGAAVTFPAIANPIGLAVGNFDGKGKIDLAVLAANGVAVLLNNGVGNFGAPSTISLSHQAQSLAAADLLGNGRGDLALANLDGTVSILLGNGAGSFQPLAALAVAANPLTAIVAADFENSGKLDLAVAQANSNLVSILRSNGDGTFQSSADLTAGLNPSALLAVDVNGDGVTDLVAVNRGANTFSVLLGIGNGSFGPSSDFVVGNTPVAAAAGLFKTGGATSLAVLNSGDNTISVPLGNGDGTFVAARAFKAGLDRKVIASGDLNGDGRSDLVVASYCSIAANCTTDGSVVVFLGNADGTYTQSASYALGRSPVAVALSDGNGDGKLDILALNRQDKTLTILPGNGDGTFGKAQIYTLSAYPSALYVGDLNGDGKADLAILTDCGQSTCSQVGSLEIWTGDGKGNFTQGASYATGYSPVSIAGADLRSTGSVDLVVANGCGESSSCSAGTALDFQNDGTGKFTAGSETSIGASPTAIALSKLNGSAISLLVAQSASNALAVLAGDGKGGFGAATQYTVGSSPSALAVADFSGDGLLDVAVVNTGSSTVSLLKGTKGSSTLQSAVSYTVGTGPQALAVVSTSKSSVASLVTANGKNTNTTAFSDMSALDHSMFGLAGDSTTTALTFSPTSMTMVDQGIQLVATITGDSNFGSPTTNSGTVTFTYGNSSGTATNPISDCTLVVDTTTFSATYKTTVTCTTYQLPALSTLYVQAAYPGDANYAESSDTETATVDLSGVTVALASADASGTAGNSTTPTPGASTVNDTVSFSTVLTPSGTYTASDMLPIYGTVAITQDSTPICTVVSTPAASTFVYNSTAGTYTASCSSTALIAEAPTGNNITAAFTPSVDSLGYTNYASGSAALKQTVSAATPNVASLVLTSPASPTVDQIINLTATLSPASPSVPYSTSAGYVAFYSVVSTTYTVVPGCTQVQVNSSGVAACTVGSLPAGSYNYAAKYLGDSNYNASAYSTSLGVTVAAASTTTTVTSSSASNTSTVNDSVTFTAVVAPNVTSYVSGSVTAINGTVTFTQGANTLCSNAAVSLVATKYQATCTTTALTEDAAPSSNNISAAFSPSDSNYASGTGTMKQFINAIGTTVAINTSSLSPASPTVDQAISLTATVSPASGTASVPYAGSIKFLRGGSSMGCDAVAVNTITGVATCSFGPLAAGGYNITAQYLGGSSNGDVNYNSSAASTADPITVGAAPTITTVTGPTTSTVNGSVTYTATVKSNVTANASTNYASWTAFPTSNASDVVNFFDNGTAITGCQNMQFTTFTAANGGTPQVSATATCTTTNLTASGTAQVISAAFNTGSGDANYTTSTSSGAGNASVTVSAATLIDSLTVSGNQVVDQSVVLTAAYSAGGAISIASASTAAVTFKDGAATLTCSESSNKLVLNTTTGNGSVTCTMTSLVAGAHSFTAVLSGDSNYTAPTASATTTIYSTPTKTVVTSSAASPTVDQSVTFYATITPVSGATNGTFTVPTSGTVSFQAVNGTTTTLCGAATVNASGVAQCSTSALLAGTAQVTATFAGDSSNYGGSTSVIFPQGVIAVGTTTTLAAAPPNNWTVGQPLVLTATVAPSGTSLVGSVALSGAVTFYDNAVAVTSCTNPVTVTYSSSAWTAACSISSLNATSHSFTATYNVSGSDTNYSLSNSNTLSASASTAATKTTVSVASTSTVDSPVLITVNVAPQNGTITAAFTGKVTITDSVTGAGGAAANCPSASITFNGSTGVATCSATALTAGSHTIGALYTAGTSDNYLTSTVNNSGAITVAEANSGLAVTSSSGATNPTSVVDGSVIFTATITPSPASPTVAVSGGKVSFTDNNSALSICTSLSVTASGMNATATCTTSALVAGSHTIAATYSGDSNYNNSTGSVGQTVTAATPAIGFTAPTSGASSAVDAAVTITAAVTPYNSSVGLTGAVAFTDSVNSGSYQPIPGCTVSFSTSTGVASCTTSLLSLGSHSFKAVYSGDTSYSTVNTTNAFTVTQAASAVTVATSGSPSNVGASVTFTATVTATVASGATLPTGTVAFTDNGTAIANCTASVLSGTTTAGLWTGTATCATSSLTAAGSPHTIKATYSGDTNFTTSNNTTSQSVGTSATKTTLISSNSAPPVDQPVTLTATVALSSGSSSSVTFNGSMTFQDCGASACTGSNGTAIAGCTTAVAVNTTSGVATCTATSLTAGTHNIIATYGSDTNFGSSSLSIAQSVVKAASSIGVVSSSTANTSSVGDTTVTFTATIATPSNAMVPLTPTSTLPSVSVGFTDNGTAISNCTAQPVTLVSGSGGLTATATCNDTTLAGGNHAIVATYTGDSNYLSNNSSVAQIVNRNNTTTTITSPAAGSSTNVGAALTLTATVALSGSSYQLPTGTMAFTDNAGALTGGCSGPISLTFVSTGLYQATCSTFAPAQGANLITATFNGASSDNNYNGSNSSVTLTVNQANATIATPALLFTTSTVDQQQTITTNVSITSLPSSNTSSPQLAGTVTFTAAAGSGSAVTLCSTKVSVVNATTASASCTTSALLAGSNLLTVAYSGDPNYTSSTPATLTTTVQQASSALALSANPVVSSPIIVYNTNGVNDQVTFTASITPVTGPSYPTGTVTFSSVNASAPGVSVAICTSKTLTTTSTSITAACSTTALAVGSNAITATYSGDANFAGSSSSVTELVQDFGVAVKSSRSFTAITENLGAFTGNAAVSEEVAASVTQGFTTSTDPFTPQTITLTPATIQLFQTGASAPLNLSCMVTSVATQAAVTYPACTLSSSTLAVLSAGTQNTVSVAIDATSSSAVAGLYSVTVKATDPTTGLIHYTTPFILGVRGAINSSIISGTTSGNSGTVTFNLPTGVTASVLTDALNSSSYCMYIGGTGISSNSTSPSAYGVSCSITPTTLGSSSSTGLQTVTATVTVTTNNTIKTSALTHDRGLLMAGLFGIPLFALIGALRGRRSFKTNLFRMLALLALGVAAMQTMGCGGSFTAPTVTQGGTTPPGTYYLLVEGKGSDGNTYDSVFQVNVEL